MASQVRVRSAGTILVYLPKDDSKDPLWVVDHLVPRNIKIKINEKITKFRNAIHALHVNRTHLLLSGRIGTGAATGRFFFGVKRLHATKAAEPQRVCGPTPVLRPWGPKKE